jgi:uncharacterized membrane protein YgaE (UPF0421/DUF939 family)
MRTRKLPWEALDTWGINLQVIKTALAAGLSWDLAVRLFGSPKPYFAPLAAILTVQATIAESLSRGVQRIVGVLAGIALAILFSRWVGINDWSLALLVFVAMALATRLQLGPQGIPQVAISALLVMAIGEEAPGYAWNRAVDTALGAVIAVIVAGAVWPPDLTPNAAESLRVLASGLHDLLNAMQRDLLEGLKPATANQHLQTARTIDHKMARARRALRQAEMSVRFNPWHRQARTRLARLRQTLETLDHCLIQIRGIARSLSATLGREGDDVSRKLPPRLAVPLGETLALMGKAVKSYADLTPGGRDITLEPLADLLHQAHVERTLLLREAVRLLPVEGMHFVDIAAVLADLEKMSQDLSTNSRLMGSKLDSEN